MGSSSSFCGGNNYVVTSDHVLALELDRISCILIGNCWNSYTIEAKESTISNACNYHSHSVNDRSSSSLRNMSIDTMAALFYGAEFHSLTQMEKNIISELGSMKLQKNLIYLIFRAISEKNIVLLKSLLRGIQNDSVILSPEGKKKRKKLN